MPMNHQLHTGRERASCTYWAVPLHKRLSLRPIHLGFVVNEVALGQVSPQVLQFSPLSTIPPMVHAHIHQSPLIYYITLAANSVIKLSTLTSPNGDTAGPECNEKSLSHCLDTIHRRPAHSDCSILSPFMPTIAIHKGTVQN
jgi:hypothetical protein